MLVAPRRYVEAVLQEVIRLHPPVPGDSKEAVKDDVLPDGTKVCEVMCLLCVPWVL